MTTALAHPSRTTKSSNGRMTEQQFVDWCDDHTWAEWVDGEVILMSPVNLEHGDIFSFLFTLFRMFVDDHDLGVVYAEPIQVRFAKLRSRRSPDLLFISADRKHIPKESHIEGAPDLIVEIISPDSQSRDYREKFLEYQSAGVREYWIVDPLSNRVEAYTLAQGRKYQPIEGKDSLKSVVLLGFSIKPAWLWRPKLPKVSTCLREMKSRK
jgi:Uma2 family endonuclease